ncbi:anti-sigma-K factor RskA [Leucobacter luti]|uniref:anti-sigma factor n=1 Tax=Leucobacter luti TaxID=340320 RepID=UPI00104BF059|nr:anti-sigma factor [Leucobacter luti]MCW2288672.1 anti-sigma-K factor RskA [Leucobacter luti]TCK45173.1 anti-sigma-K factor RskA [Leucobacter luti]
MNEHEFRELSALRAVHALSPDEEQVFSATLAAHPEWQWIVEEDRATAAALGASVREVAPPVTARASILDAIALAPQFERAAQDPDPIPHPRQADLTDVPELAEYADDDESELSARPRRRLGWLVLAASVAILLVFSFSFPLRGLLAPPDPVTVALEQLAAAPDAQYVTAPITGAGQATLHWSRAKGQAVLVAAGLPELAGSHDFELWIVRDGTPKSLGLVSVDAQRNAAVLASDVKPGDALAVTVEDRGGSATGAPTTEPILVVATPASSPGGLEET